MNSKILSIVLDAITLAFVPAVIAAFLLHHGISTDQENLIVSGGLFAVVTLVAVLFAWRSNKRSA